MYGCAIGFVITAVLAVRLVADEFARVSTLKSGAATAGPMRVGTLLVGYATIGLTTLHLLALPLGHLLVGGAITGVVIGIAAQQMPGNLFAGLVLLFTRPYVPGERIRVRSGAPGGPFEGTVTGLGSLYTTLARDEGPINIPNSDCSRPRSVRPSLSRSRSGISSDGPRTHRHHTRAGS